MKKIFTILGALALTVAMNAQQLARMPKPQLVKCDIPSAVYDGELSAEGYTADAVPLRAPKADLDTTLFGIYGVNGQMAYSAKPGYVTPAGLFIIKPYSDTTYFESFYGKGDWKYEAFDEEEEDYETITVKDTDILAYPSTSYGQDYINPTLQVYPNEQELVDQQTGDVNIYNTTYEEYMANAGVDIFWPGEYYPTFMMNGYWQPWPLTNCEMFTGYHTNSGDAEYDEQAAANCFMVSSGAAGTKWCYGTGMTISSWGKGTLDTLINIIPIPEGKSMWCDSVFVHCYNREAVDIENVFPTTTDLKLTIYPIIIKEDPETGKLVQYLRHDSVMAQATATQKNCVEDGGGYTIQFVFKEKNPFGTMDVKPATFGQYCYAELTGFNKSKCNFGIFCSYYENPLEGRTLWEKNGKFHSYGGMNIDMAFNAYYTDIHMWDDCWINEVDKEGGVLTMGFLGTDGKTYSTDTIEFACNISTDFEDDADLYDANGEIIDLDTEEFIEDYEIITGPYTYEEGGEEWISLSCQLTIEVQPNPTKNDREYTVYLQAYGAKMPIVIKQKGEGSGLFNVKAVNDNKYYNIFGTEVNKNFKGIVIRNGQTLLQ